MSFLIDRHSTRSVTEAEESKVREEIDVWVRASGSTTSKLHVPDTSCEGLPLCDFQKYTEPNWTEDPVEVYPPGHREVCSLCVDEFFRQVGTGEY